MRHGLKLNRSEGGFTVTYVNGTDYAPAHEVPTFAEASALLREAVALGGTAVALDEAWYGPEADEGPSCSLCDALGHGYPGGGPCPLEERGYWDAEEDRQRYGAF